MSRIAMVLLSVLVACACLASQARADGAPRTVVMIVDPGVAPLARRLRQEIESLGLAVRQVPADAPHSSLLEDEALAAGAVAAIHIAPMGGGDVDMTILDSATGKTVSWKLVAATTVEPAAAELIATRTVELLRASLIEMAARRPPRADASVPEIQAAPLSGSEAHRRDGGLSLSVGSALLYSADFRPGAELEAAGIWMPLQRLGVSAAILVPMAPARLTSRQGTVDLFASLYRFAPVVELGARSSPVLLRCALGAELARLHFDGTASAPYVGAVDARTTGAAWAGLVARFRVAPSLYIATELTAAMAFPRTVVRVAGHEVTDWGQPLGTAAIGIELAWPPVDRRPLDTQPATMTGAR